MPRDRLLSRKATQASRTPLTPTPALSSTLSSAQTDAPTQQPASEPAQSAHNFSDVSVLAQEPQPAEEQEEQTAIDTEQSNQIVAKQGAGTPLAPSVRENMEAAFGYNFITSDRDAYEAKRALARTQGLLVGISAGANAFIAYQVAAELGPGHHVVTLLCDTGERYFSLDEYF